MSRIVIFCEDSSHETIVKALINKLLLPTEFQVQVLSARRGKGRALNELEKYFKEVEQGLIPSPAVIITAIDANCEGYAKKKKEIDSKRPSSMKHIRIIHAIPDPHVERWLLIDSHAFKRVFGSGCKAPNKKCQKDRYKVLLREAIKAAGGVSILGGLEHAEEIVKNMNIEKSRKLDKSFNCFIKEIEEFIDKIHS